MTAPGTEWTVSCLLASVFSSDIDESIQLLAVGSGRGGGVRGLHCMPPLEMLLLEIVQQSISKERSP
jgi:hypothetical protein